MNEVEKARIRQNRCVTCGAFNEDGCDCEENMKEELNEKEQEADADTR